MSEDKREDLLRKVRGLLAKANDPAVIGTPESDVFRAKADELMTKYAIESWEFEQAHPETKQKPIRKDFDFTWYYEDAVGEQLWPMFLRLASHCRCVVANLNITRTWDNRYHIPVFGSESDIAYLDMLFTDLFIQFSAKLSPVFDPSKSRAENIYVAKEAGMSWKDIASWIGEPELVKYRADGSVASISGSLKRDYRAWANATETEFHTSNPASYVRSFATGFAHGVIEKLREMDQDQGKNTGSMALVIRDITEDARAQMFEEFPNQAKKSRAVARRETRKLDTTGLAKGNKAGKEANIASKGDRTMKQSRKKELT